jgi:hypothetical protein
LRRGWVDGCGNSRALPSAGNAGARIRDRAGWCSVNPARKLPVSKPRCCVETWVDRPCLLPAPCWARMMRVNYRVYSLVVAPKHDLAILDKYQTSLAVRRVPDS